MVRRLRSLRSLLSLLSFLTLIPSLPSLLSLLTSEALYTIPSTIPNDQLYWDATTDITIKADVYITSIAVHHSDVIASYGGYGDRTTYVFGIDGTNLCAGMCPSSTPGAVLFVIGTEGVSFRWIKTTTAVPLNTWTTIMVKRISGTYSLYIKGASQSINTYGSVDSNVIGNAAIPVTVGGNLNGQLRNLVINGKLIGKKYYCADNNNDTADTIIVYFTDIIVMIMIMIMIVMALLTTTANHYHLLLLLLLLLISLL